MNLLLLVPVLRHYINMSMYYQTYPCQHEVTLATLEGKVLDSTCPSIKNAGFEEHLKHLQKKPCKIYVRVNVGTVRIN